MVTVGPAAAQMQGEVDLGWREFNQRRINRRYWV
jgi:hypothetical protein